MRFGSTPSSTARPSDSAHARVRPMHLAAGGSVTGDDNPHHIDLSAFSLAVTVTFVPCDPTH